METWVAEYAVEILIAVSAGVACGTCVALVMKFRRGPKHAGRETVEAHVREMHKKIDSIQTQVDTSTRVTNEMACASHLFSLPEQIKRLRQEIQAVLSMMQEIKALLLDKNATPGPSSTGGESTTRQRFRIDEISGDKKRKCSPKKPVRKKKDTTKQKTESYTEQTE